MSEASDFGTPVLPYTAVPNAFLDLLMADCTGAETKAFLYIVRRTRGTRRGRENGSDAIALSQICGGIVKKDGTRLDRGTGLARAAAVEALYRLEFAGIIERDRGSGRIPDTWRLAAELPATKVQAPEKRFRNRTGSGSKSEPVSTVSGSKSEPLTGSKSEPLTGFSGSEIEPTKERLKKRGKESQSSSLVEDAALAEPTDRTAEYTTKDRHELSEVIGSYGLRRKMQEHMRGKPPLGVVEACLKAADGLPVLEIFGILREKCLRGFEPGSSKGPQGWGWFPTVIGNEVKSRQDYGAVSTEAIT
jgi:hypothetical protein